MTIVLSVTKRGGDEAWAWCDKCEPPRRLPLEDVALYLLEEHGIDLDAEMERWPDGDPVIVDLTLVPSDFEPLGNE